MIKKRNLDPSLLTWIMVSTGLGPGIGEIKYVAKTNSGYYQKLIDDGNVPESDIFDTVTKGENALTASRNDMLLVLPGAYSESASITWDKAHTHLIGLGGPGGINNDHSEPNVVIQQNTTGQVTTMTISGGSCMFKNALFLNTGNHSTNTCAISVETYASYFENVAFMGNFGANQNDKSSCCSLIITASSFGSIFRGCTIGQPNWGTRAAANSGALLFNGTGVQPSGNHWYDCHFVQQTNTATVALVRVVGSNAVGRDTLFKNCTFHHFDTDGDGTNANQVFYSTGLPQKDSIMLMMCGAFGFDEWQDADDQMILCMSPATSDGSGIAQQPTDVVAA